MFRITVRDNDTGATGITNLFKINNGLNPPTVQISEVIVNETECLKIIYQSSDIDSQLMITTDWQYSFDTQTWENIDTAFISNNFLKQAGIQYIEWNFYNLYIKKYVYFRMKVCDEKNIKSEYAQSNRFYINNIMFCDFSDTELQITVDGEISYKDLLIFTTHFQTKLNDPNYDNLFDLNNDNVVDYDDLIIFLMNYGKTRGSW